MSLFGPGTSPRVKGFPNRKPPALLPFYSGLAAPEWDWFWDDLSAGWINWEGGGAVSRGFGPLGENLTLNSGTGIVPWNPGPYGIGLDFASGHKVFAGTSDIIEEGNHAIISVLRFDSLSGLQTIIAKRDSFVNANMRWQHILNGTQLRMQTTATSNTWPNMVVGDQVIGINDTGAATKLFIDGVFKANGTLTTVTFDTDAASQVSVGALADANIPLQGLLYACYTMNRALSDGEHEQIGADPFGPFRTRSLPLFLPSAAADSLAVAPMISPTPRWDRKVRFY